MLNLQIGNGHAQTPSYTHINYSLSEIYFTTMYMLIDMKKEHARFVQQKVEHGLEMKTSTRDVCLKNILLLNIFLVQLLL